MGRYGRRRRFRRRPRRGRRRRYNRRRGIKALINKQIARNAEHKQLWETMADDFPSISNAWQDYDLTAMGRGTDKDQYTGDVIRIKSIWMWGTLAAGTSNSIADDRYNHVRIVIAKWQEAANTAPLGSANWPMEWPINHQSVGGQLRTLIKKYYDRTFYFTSPGKDSTGYMPTIRKMKFFKRFKGLGMKLRKAVAQPTDQPDYRIIVSMISDSAAVPNPGFLMGTWGINWTDG